MPEVSEQMEVEGAVFSSATQVPPVEALANKTFEFNSSISLNSIGTQLQQRKPNLDTDRANSIKETWTAGR